VSNGPQVSRAELAGDVVMLYDECGNAYYAFEYTPEALEAEARRLRKALGESTTITYRPSPFITGQGGDSGGKVD
jgi:hypothetical protein